MSNVDHPTAHIVDTDDAARARLTALFDSASLAHNAYSNTQDLLTSDTVHRPGCLILALPVTDPDVSTLQAILDAQFSSLPVIFIDDGSDLSVVVQAMRSGAFDFLARPVDEDRLLEIVRKAIELDHEQRAAKTHVQLVKTRLKSLTPRETQTLEALSLGLTSKQIARQLDISPKTVELYRGNIHDKMDTNSIAALVTAYLLGTGADPSHSVSQSATERTPE